MYQKTWPQNHILYRKEFIYCFFTHVIFISKCLSGFVYVSQTKPNLTNWKLLSIRLPLEIVAWIMSLLGTTRRKIIGQPLPSNLLVLKEWDIIQEGIIWLTSSLEGRYFGSLDWTQLNLMDLRKHRIWVIFCDMKILLLSLFTGNLGPYKERWATRSLGTDP